MAGCGLQMADGGWQSTEANLKLQQPLAVFRRGLPMPYPCNAIPTQKCQTINLETNPKTGFTAIEFVVWVAIPPPRFARHPPNLTVGRGWVGFNLQPNPSTYILRFWQSPPRRSLSPSRGHARVGQAQPPKSNPWCFHARRRCRESQTWHGMQH
jgi:hypothetical protein